MIRVLDLERNGVKILLSEDDDLGLLKEATFYLAKKTEKMTDGEFGAWLKDIYHNGWLIEKNNELERDVFSGNFTFLQKDREELKGFIGIVLDYLFKENSEFLNSNE